MGLRDDILGLDDLRTKEVAVPVWNRTLTVREMGLQESLSLFGPSNVSDDGKIKLDALDIARVVVCCVVDPESGERVLTDDDAEALAGKSRVALMALYNEITALSGSVEDAAKN